VNAEGIHPLELIFDVKNPEGLCALYCVC
jgi:hypothetical protein